MIPFSLLPENIYNRRPTGNIWLKGYQELIKVWKRLRDYRDLKLYLIAFFFYNSGVQTVMYLATLFGTDVLHLESSKLILTILIIQLVLSAFFSAQIPPRISALRFPISDLEDDKVPQRATNPPYYLFETYAGRHAG